jgi:DNA mismatch repair ATPase MutS
LEGWKAESTWLERVQTRVAGGGQPASVAMQTFASRVAWFEARHNGLIYPFLNVLFLWDLNSVLALQRWKAQWGKSVRSWFEAIGELEAVSSLAGFSHDNPDYAWPEFAAPGDGTIFEAEALGHPLIPRPNRVGNDVNLGGSVRALLVTGSNMSGKSTLLRAMGVAAVLALAGAPACARRLRLSPLFVCTSKLRRVILAAQGGRRVLFLLDEILHGTNSRERQIGARWVLAEMLKEDAVGAVSTHDQGLCDLPEASLSERVRQVHLREQVSGGQMTFDYQLREGPVSGGNALRLMRSLGLEVPLDDSA